MGGDLGRRILFAVPAVGFAVFIIYEGGWIFAAGIALLGVIAVHELSTMLERARPVRLAAMLGVLEHRADGEFMRIPAVIAHDEAHRLAVAHVERPQRDGVVDGDDLDVAQGPGRLLDVTGVDRAADVGG